MKLLVFILLLSFNNLSAVENEWSLKAGLGFNLQSLSIQNIDSNDLFGLSGNTSFGYRYVDFGIYATSYLTFGKANNLYFKIGDAFESYANANYWTVNFLLLFKYYTNIIVFKNYEFYLSLGPGVSIDTFDPSQSNPINDVSSNTQKVTYETYGIYGTLGIEEKTLFKEEFPLFAEFLWGFSDAYKANLVSVSNAKTTTILVTDENANFKNFILILNFGLTFF